VKAKDVVKPSTELIAPAWCRAGTVVFQIGIELPDQRADTLLGGTLLVGECLQLVHQALGVNIHPRDLALRDAHLTASYGPAAAAGHLAAELPATTADGFEFEIPPSDHAADQALRFAAVWRRLAEFRGWKPLENADTLQETLQFLGCAAPLAEIQDWLAITEQLQEPALIRAGRAARDWMNRPHTTKPLTQDGLCLASCLWRQSGSALALPFWLAPEQRFNRLALRVGVEWLAGFLDCVAEAARIGMTELVRLQTAAEKAAFLGGTARSKLPLASDAVLRAPVMTACGLAKQLDITPQAALGLLQQLTAAVIIREATGRASWRAFTI
jgi:HTH DNA binding domain